MKAEILRRLRVKIDGRPGGCARATNPSGRRSFTSGRRAWAVDHALMWKALGYQDVEVAFSTPRDPQGTFRPFPATQAEAVECVRELAAGKLGSRWRRLADRIDRQEVR